MPSSTEGRLPTLDDKSFLMLSILLEIFSSCSSTVLIVSRKLVKKPSRSMGFKVLMSLTKFESLLSSNVAISMISFKFLSKMLVICPSFSVLTTSEGNPSIIDSACCAIVLISTIVLPAVPWKLLKSISTIFVTSLKFVRVLIIVSKPLVILAVVVFKLVIKLPVIDKS